MTEIKSSADQLLDHRKRKEALVQLEAEQHFSYSLEAGLTDDERAADVKLRAMRDEIADNEKMNRTIHNFWEHKETMENCSLFKALNSMPKGGIHHIHTTAANPIDAYLELTYDDAVYYQNKEKLFKVYPKHEGVADGYIQCTKLRSFSKTPEEFDT